jgi:spore maturation protein CgeB
LPKPKRIAIFAEDDHMYINQTLGLKRGFEELGVEIHVGWPHLNERALTCFVDNYQPDFILEIDRFPSQIPGYVPTVKHLTWIHNHAVHGRRVLEDAFGSYAVYTALLLKVYGHEDFNGGDCQFLPMATDPSIFMDASAPEVFDFSFIGHMYGPITDDVLNIQVANDGNRDFLMQDLIEEFLKAGFRHSNSDNSEIHSFLANYLSHFYPNFTTANLTSAIKTFFDESLIRLIDRKDTMEVLLSISKQIAFFGNPDWQQWPQFAPYYMGSINRSRQMAQLFHSTRLNIHNGPVTMHNRVLDIMCCGKPILVSRSRWDDEISSIQHYFSPGDDYIPYDLVDLHDVAESALGDREKRSRIGKNAQRRILDGHTWRHRAAFIINDLAQR